MIERVRFAHSLLNCERSKALAVITRNFYYDVTRHGCEMLKMQRSANYVVYTWKIGCPENLIKSCTSRHILGNFEGNFL